MNKIAIIIFSNLIYSPYYKLYTEILDNLGYEYDVIYCNRFPKTNETVDKNHIQIPWYDNNAKFNRIINFISFKEKVSKILKRNDYSKVIVLTTNPAILLSKVLIKKYNKKFLIDVRDFCQENLSLYRKLEERLFKHASVRIISSPGFKNFLPKEDYCVCHNLSSNIKFNELDKFHLTLNRNKRIKISYIGSIAYANQCKKIIDLVEKDDRFEMLFFGNETEGTIVSNYVKSKNNERISMMGPFLPTEKEKIYENTDMVFNCYGNDSDLLTYALSNKLYDGAFYKRPLLVSPNTLMQEISGKFAYSLDLSSSTNLDGLYNWYQNLNEKEYEEFAESLLKDSINETEQSKKTIKDAILN